MRRIAILVVAALLALSALAPAAAAQDEPAVVFPCFDGGTFEVDEGQEIYLYCGWGVNAKGLIRAYLTSVERSLVLTDEAGNVVWQRDPEASAGDWMEPVSGRASDYPPLVCHPDVGWAIFWDYILAPLDAGTYTLTEVETLRHPVTDGYHQCWYDGERLAPPPSLYSGATVTTVTIVVG